MPYEYAYTYGKNTFVSFSVIDIIFCVRLLQFARSTNQGNAKASTSGTSSWYGSHAFLFIIFKPKKGVLRHSYFSTIMNCTFRFAGVLILLLSCFIPSNAAAPPEITIDSLHYRVVNNEAIVSPVYDNVYEANILEKVEIKGIEYPVTKIAGNAFEFNTSLFKVLIPSSIKIIGAGAFHGCSNLVHINLPSSLENIGTMVFAQCLSLESIIIPSGIKIIPTQTFFRCSNLKNVELPEGLTHILSGAFEGCSSLKEIIIPSTVSTMESAFNDSGLESIILPDGLLGVTGFAYCSNLIDVFIPESVVSIGESAFLFSNLSYINIPANVENIGIKAFAFCKNLETINSYNITPPKMGSDVFYGSYPEYITLHVPKGSKDDYANSDEWKKIGTIIDDLPNNDISGLNNIYLNDIDNSEESSDYEIFLLSGLKINKEFNTLPSGFYIIKNNNITNKLIIK